MTELPVPESIDPPHCAWCKATRIRKDGRDGKWFLFYCWVCGSEWFGIWRQLPGREPRWLCPLPYWGAK